MSGLALSASRRLLSRLYATRSFAGLLVDTPAKPLVGDRDQPRRPLAGVVVQPGQQCWVVALPWRSSWSSHRYISMGISQPPRSLENLQSTSRPAIRPVEIVAVGELELLRQVHLDGGAQVRLLGLRQVLVGPAPGALAVEQLVEGVAQRPAESLARIRLALEPLCDRRRARRGLPDRGRRRIAHAAGIRPMRSRGTGCVRKRVPLSPASPAPGSPGRAVPAQPRTVGLSVVTRASLTSCGRTASRGSA